MPYIKDQTSILVDSVCCFISIIESLMQINLCFGKARGSYLRPSLFLMCINDLPTISTVAYLYFWMIPKSLELLFLYLLNKYLFRVNSTRSLAIGAPHHMSYAFSFIHMQMNRHKYCHSYIALFVLTRSTEVCKQLISYENNFRSTFYCGLEFEDCIKATRNVGLTL